MLPGDEGSPSLSRRRLWRGHSYHSVVDTIISERSSAVEVPGAEILELVNMNSDIDSRKTNMRRFVENFLLKASFDSFFSIISSKRFVFTLKFIFDTV